MCRRSVYFLVALSVLSVTVAETRGSPYDRVAYWDGSSGTAWAGDGIAVRDALQQAGYTVVSAAELKTWMDARIADKKLSVVVMCRDVVPASVAETQDTNCTIRRYLDAGGKVVWYSDWPFYYCGTTSTVWNSSGAINVLGFNASSGPNEQNQQVTITEAGRRWGLTTPWSSARPTSPTITPDLTVLATDNNGNAAGWVKHYVPGDTYRGFVRIDDHSGAPVNIPQLMAVAEYFEVSTTAVSPVPANGATDVPRDVVLGWTPGEYAATHDVYLGTTLADVDGAGRADPRGVLASQGQTDVAYDPEGLLEFGQIYHWRIDEVNAAPSNMIFKGEVWSFTVEAFAYPIENVMATASSVSRADMGPENTVNGSGLNLDDQHSTEPTEMWMSDGTLPNWIQYEFDKVYKLGELRVWNYNNVVESIVGFGARNVTIEYSLDGAAWAAIEDVPEFVRAPGAAICTADTVVDLGGVMAKYVKLTIDQTWGGRTQTGLSEVRFYQIPVQAREPQPADNAADVSLDAQMNWRPGREATSHQIFFGADGDAVAEGLAMSATVTDHRYTPAAMSFGTTYYWKVDEIGESGTYEGDLWSFTSQEFALIEDFESYDDQNGSRVFDLWLDGYDGSSGSIVGYLDSASGTFGETSIIHGGAQSMPFEYDNSDTPFYSEAVREFETVQNWTGSGATELCVWTRGYPALGNVAVTETGGKMTLTGAGRDIWDNSDEFTYAFKTLAGDGALVARVVSNGTGTNEWTKGGVMIRDSLNGGSTHATMCITGGGGNGAAFQNRPTADQASVGSDSTSAITLPYWVKIERTGDSFTGSVSADGKTWSVVGTTVIVMEAPVYIGLAVTSHVAGTDRTFQFESIAATGAVTGAWQGAVISSPLHNDPAPMYLIVEDSTGKKATATSATAVTAADWTRWTIPMIDLAPVSFSKVKKLTIGVGTRGSSIAGGKGMVFIDDIGFGHSAQ